MEVERDERNEGAEAPKKNWNDFVNTTLVDLFQANQLKTLAAEDNDGNKVKLSLKMIEGEEVLKVEISSTSYQ